MSAHSIQNFHQSIDGKTIQIYVADTGKIGVGNPCPFPRSPYRQTFTVQDSDDFSGQQSLGLLHIGIRQAEISKHVATASGYFKFFCHRNSSFTYFIRALIRLMSFWYVLIPVVDFFWNT